ncbi:MAG: DUF6788 family protein [Acidimicrobiales bacterium]
MPTRARSEEGLVMLKGSLYTLRRRCGKPNCRCASGDAHESPALAYPRAGRTGTLSLTGVDLEEVSAALARYDLARSELDALADAGIVALSARLAARRQRRVS